MTPPSEYEHPESGQIYREGDPTHRFAQLFKALYRQCESFVDYTTPLVGRDYLDQFNAWQGDPERIARAMADTIRALNRAVTDIVVDRDAHLYGLGAKDDEWTRKYGNPGEPTIITTRTEDLS